MKKLNHNTIKGFGAGLLVAAVIAGSGLPAQALSTFQQINVSMGGISLFVDGKLQVPTDVNGNEVEPLIYAGTTYLPVRALTGMLTDKAVEWDPKTESVYIGTKPGAGRVVRADELTPYDSSTPLAWATPIPVVMLLLKNSSSMAMAWGWNWVSSRSRSSAIWHSRAGRGSPAGVVMAPH